MRTDQLGRQRFHSSEPSAVRAGRALVSRQVHLVETFNFQMFVVGFFLALIVSYLTWLACPCIANAQSGGEDSAVIPDWAISAHWQALQLPIPEKKITIAPIPPTIPQSDTTSDPSGSLTTYQPGGSTTTSNNAFFQSLGTNGRSCFSCHEPQDGWTLTPSDVTSRFNES